MQIFVFFLQSWILYHLFYYAWSSWIGSLFVMRGEKEQQILIFDIIKRLRDIPNYGNNISFWLNSSGWSNKVKLLLLMLIITVHIYTKCLTVGKSKGTFLTTFSYSNLFIDNFFNLHWMMFHSIEDIIIFFWNNVPWSPLIL